MNQVGVTKLKQTTISPIDAKRALARLDEELKQARATLEIAEQYTLSGASGYRNGQRLAAARTALEAVTLRREKAAAVHAEAATTIESADDHLANLVRSIIEANALDLSLTGVHLAVRKRPGLDVPEITPQIAICQQEPTRFTGGGSASGRVFLVIYGKQDQIRSIDAQKLTAVLAKNGCKVSIGNAHPVEKLEDGHVRKQYSITFERAEFTVPPIANPGRANYIAGFAKRFAAIARDLPYRFDTNGKVVAISNVTVLADVFADEPATIERNDSGEHFATFTFSVQVGPTFATAGYETADLIAKLTPRYEGLGVGTFAPGLGRVVDVRVTDATPAGKYGALLTMTGSAVFGDMPTD